GMLEFDDRLAGLDLRVAQRLRDAVHTRIRDAGLREHGDPVRRVPARERRIEDLEQLVAVPVAVGELAEARILTELGMSDGVAEPQPELLLCARDHDPAIRRA